MTQATPFIQARYFHKSHRERVDYIVIHCMQLPCKVGLAQRLGDRFQLAMEQGKEKSAHYGIDPGAVIQYVHETDVAFHCKGANARGVGLEHAGYGPGVAGRAGVPAADGKPALHHKNPIEATDYTTGDGLKVLRLSAALAGPMAAYWKIPVVRLSPAQIVAGERGFAGHVDFSEAFATPGGHRDPGPAWPWDLYLELVRASMTTGAGTPGVAA